MKEEVKAQEQKKPAPQIAEKNKKSNEDYQKQALENKKRWMPFIRFMKKKGLKIKTARCGKVRIQYFRTDELEALISDHREELQKNNVLRDLAFVWQKEVMYFSRPENLPKLKYPNQLERSQANSKSKFASFKFDLAEPKTWLFPAIIFGVIAVVLFPLWPYMLKYIIFMISLVLVIAILSIIVFRLIAYLFVAIFGYSFWVLPNFFADCTIAESFRPVFSIKKWESGMFSIIGRLLALSIFAYYSYHLYLDSSWVYENIEITKTSLDDLHDWGVSKIKGEKNFSQSALTNLDHIMNQTEQIYAEDTVTFGEQQFKTEQTENTATDETGQQNVADQNQENTQGQKVTDDSAQI